GGERAVAAAAEGRRLHAEVRVLPALFCDFTSETDHEAVREESDCLAANGSSDALPRLPLVDAFKGVVDPLGIFCGKFRFEGVAPAYSGDEMQACSVRPIPQMIDAKSGTSSRYTRH